jgi:beta-phosphoglucomutase-like phosphatase (HAD superfamily)
VNLAIFDIDGTLTNSNAIDAQCFAETFESEFGLSAPIDWSEYPHHTDRGLTQEFLRRAWSREPGEEAIARHRAAFVTLLQTRVPQIDEIRGARSFLDDLRRRGWRVALATGAWSESARLKLSAAGLPVDLPLACCDDCVSREEIVRRAIGNDQYARVVVFGDGTWDVRTARNLRLPFVGVGSDDPDAVFRAMRRAEVPRSQAIAGVP